MSKSHYQSSISPKKLVILGSTGKIGQHALNIVDRFPDRFQVIGLSCFHPSPLFDAQLTKYKPRASCIASTNPTGLLDLARLPDADLVVVGVVGAAGLAPTLAAIQTKTNVALATKEVMVIAGDLITAQARKNHVKIIPIDSELSAIFQSLHAGHRRSVERAYLTMGQGSIAKLSPSQMATLSPAQVLQTNHWVMGQKIMVDSATCVNKVFEAIETHHFFHLTANQISVVVHPEYLCHSLVEFIDGSIIGEFGTANMDRYLQFALCYPQRCPAPPSAHLSLFDQHLSFLPPDTTRFPVLTLIPTLLQSRKNLAAVFHGADDICVQYFLEEKINFTAIGAILIQALEEANSSTYAHFFTLPRSTTLDQKLAHSLELEKLGQKIALEIIAKGSYVQK